MAREIERKFLVCGDYKSHAKMNARIVQGYLSSVPQRTVRVRTKGERAYLTIKGEGDERGISRYEWEREIPFDEAVELLELCESGTIDKTRYVIRHGGHVFEVDEFHGRNEGLTVAEIELESEDEPFDRPDWLGEEVTGDDRYYNAMLTKNPYKEWK